MKLAIISAVQAFVQQVKENTVELAKKTCENNGYTVNKKQPKKEDK